MTAYIINLDAAPERWKFMEKSFAGLTLNLCRVPAVDGHALPLPVAECSETRYRWFHGKNVRPGEIGCYLSHLKACHAFLATADDHALICEDDVVFRSGFQAVLHDALRYRAFWNILRVTGLSEGVSLAAQKLTAGYSLCVGFGRLKGAGAYVLDRAAAHAFVSGLLPMRVPFDHAFDREWFYGLRAACVLPFPASQREGGFRSSVQFGKRSALSFSGLRRFFVTYPYQASNEICRWVCRGWSYLRLNQQSSTSD